MCFHLNILGIDDFTQSVKVSDPEPKQYVLIKFNDLISRKTYQKKYMQNECFIVFDSLELKKLCQLR